MTDIQQGSVRAFVVKAQQTRISSRRTEVGTRVGRKVGGAVGTCDGNDNDTPFRVSLCHASHGCVPPPPTRVGATLGATVGRVGSTVGRELGACRISRQPITAASPVQLSAAQGRR